MFSSSPIVSGSSGMSISLALIIFWISTIEYWSILYGSQTWPSSAFEQTLFPSRRLITTFLGILTLKLAKMFWIRVIILRIIWLLLGLVCSLFGIVPPLLSSDAIKTTAIVRSRVHDINNNLFSVLFFSFVSFLRESQIQHVETFCFNKFHPLHLSI